jgi:hypothetical protein
VSEAKAVKMAEGVSGMQSSVPGSRAAPVRASPVRDSMAKKRVSLVPFATQAAAAGPASRTTAGTQIRTEKKRFIENLFHEHWRGTAFGKSGIAKISQR